MKNDCILSMIDLGLFFRKIVIRSFWSHKKGSRNIFFYLIKLSRLRGQCCSTALVQSNN